MRRAGGDDILLTVDNVDEYVELLPKVQCVFCMYVYIYIHTYIYIYKYIYIMYILVVCMYMYTYVYI